MKRALIISYLLILIDQFSKLFLLVILQNPLSLFWGLLTVNLQFNPGIAFSIPLFSWLIIPLIIATIIGGTIVSYYSLNWDNKIHFGGFCFILSGAIGNLIDRVFHGQVIDFIKIGWWPVFNLADVFITLGAALIIWTSFQKKSSPAFIF